MYHNVKKIEKQKLQLSRVRRPESRALTPSDDSRAQQKDTSPLLARTQPMKSHRLFVYYGHPNFLFLLILKKPIFVGEISGSLFFLGQQ